MKDQSKTKQALIQELVSLRERIAELQQSESERKKAEEEILSLSKFPSENPSPVLRIAKDGEILYSNKAGLELLVHWNVEIGEKAPKKWCCLIKKTLESETPGLQEEEVKNKIFSVAISPVAEAGYVNLYCRDITERKQAESRQEAAIEELRESEERFKNLYQDSPIPTFTWKKKGEDFVLVDFNKAAMQMTNGKVADILGNSAMELYTDRPQILNDMNLCFQERSVMRREIVSHHFAPGRFLTVSYGFIRPDLIIVHTEDQTVRKQAESRREAALEKLQASETKYRDLVENINDIIFSLNKEGRFTYVNPASERVLGYSPVDLIGHQFSELIHPEDLPLVITAFKNVQSGIIGPTEYRVFNKSGDIRWIRSSSRPNYINGNAEGLKGIAADITGQKLAAAATADSEERYHFLFENMLEGFAYCRMIYAEGQPQDLLYLAVNKAFNQLTGLEDVVGRKITEVIPGIKETNPELLEIYGRVALTGKPERFEDYFEFLKGWLSISVYSPAKGYFVAVFDNTSERKRVEAELGTSHLQLRALAGRIQQIREEERARIAREIHDEMGGGLTGLKLDLSWLLRKMDDADKGEESVALMDKIHASNVLIDQMISTVRRISTYLRPSVLDDLGLIAALDWQLSEFTHHTEIPNEYSTTCEYVNVEKDTAVAVFRIFQEALTNVARHSGATKVAVVIRDDERSLFGDESLVLEIRDNGRGITQEEIMNSESLGLLGMKERVLAFGGELSIRGEPSGGTALIVKIPLIQGESS